MCSGINPKMEQKQADREKDGWLDKATDVDRSTVMMTKDLDWNVIFEIKALLRLNIGLKSFHLFMKE